MAKWFLNVLGRLPDPENPPTRNTRYGLLTVGAHPVDEFIELEGAVEAADAYEAVAIAAKAIRPAVDLNRDVEIMVTPK